MQRFNVKIKGLYLFDLISIFARIFLGIIFLFAAIGKIPHLSEFRANVTAYHILPISIVPIFSYILPFIELLISIYLILGLFLSAITIVTILLLIIFIMALTYAILTGQPVSGCGCFSQSSGGIGWIDIIRDIFFLICAIFILLTHSSFLSLDYLLHKKEKHDKDNQPS